MKFHQHKEMWSWWPLAFLFYTFNIHFYYQFICIISSFEILYFEAASYIFLSSIHVQLRKGYGLRIISAGSTIPVGMKIQPRGKNQKVFFKKIQIHPPYLWLWDQQFGPKTGPNLGQEDKLVLPVRDWKSFPVVSRKCGNILKLYPGFLSLSRLQKVHERHQKCISKIFHEL